MGVGVGIQVWTKELGENSLPDSHPLFPFSRACVQSLHFWALCLQAWLIIHAQAGSVSATVLGYFEGLWCCPSTKGTLKGVISENDQHGGVMQFNMKQGFCYHLEVGGFVFVYFE